MTVFAVSTTRDGVLIAAFRNQATAYHFMANVKTAIPLSVVAVESENLSALFKVEAKHG